MSKKLKQNRYGLKKQASPQNSENPVFQNGKARFAVLAIVLVLVVFTAFAAGHKPSAESGTKKPWTEAIVREDGEILKYDDIKLISYGDVVKFKAKGKELSFPNTDVIIADHKSSGYHGFHATEYHDAFISFDQDVEDDKISTIDGMSARADIYHVEDSPDCEESPAKLLYAPDVIYYVTEGSYRYIPIHHEDSGNNTFSE